MRRMIAFGVLVLVALALAPQAASAVARSYPKETASYSPDGAQFFLGDVSCPDGEATAGGPQVGLGLDSPTVFFKVPNLARRVSFNIADQTGTPVMAYVWHGGHPVGGFCGRTAHPFALRGRGRLWVSLFDAVTPNDGPSIVTSGTVTARFSR